MKVAKSTDLHESVKVASGSKSMHSQFLHMTQYSILSRDPLTDKSSNFAFLVILNKQFCQHTDNGLNLELSNVHFSLLGLRKLPIRQQNEKIRLECGFSGLQNWEGNFLQHAEILPQAANNHSYFFLKSNFTQ